MSYPCWDEVQRIDGSCAEHDAERYIEMIDAAIHYANIKLRSNALARAILHGARIERRGCAVRERQAELDELAKRLAKPDCSGSRKFRRLNRAGTPRCHPAGGLGAPPHALPGRRTIWPHTSKAADNFDKYSIICRF
jgi:hypothetical protein